jgi:hypothetical protein
MTVRCSGKSHRNMPHLRQFFNDLLSTAVLDSLLNFFICCIETPQSDEFPTNEKVSYSYCEFVRFESTVAYLIVKSGRFVVWNSILMKEVRVAVYEHQ